MNSFYEGNADFPNKSLQEFRNTFYDSDIAFPQKFV